MVGLKLNARFQNQTTADGSIKAAMQSARHVAQLVRRDLMYQSAMAIGANGTQLSIRRRGIAPSPNYGSYDVRYRSRCRSVPGNLNNPLSEIYSSANRAQIFTGEASCFRQLNCNVGQYPELQFSVTGPAAATPSYPFSRLPDFSTISQRNKIWHGVAGFAACYELNNGAIELVVDSLVPIRRDDTSSFQVLTNRSTINTIRLPFEPLP